MDILAVSDPHASAKAFKAIKDKKADLILVAGDMTIFGTDMERICRKMDSWKTQTLVIPGNHEDPEELERACSKSRNIIYANEMLYEKDDVLVLSIEGSGFAYTDKRFERAARRFIPKIKEKRKKASSEGRELHLILMTHAPPYNTKLDKLTGGEHCGNKSIRDFIIKLQPELAISGHIHESFGKEDWIKDTRVVNPGIYGRMFSF